jgi:pimeloyl-ACP methyl ester carboxylesterase
MTVHTVRGAAGVELHVREWGNPTGIPILLIHGWSQNHLCWMKQQESGPLDEFRIVAFDLRGHGMSDAPLDAGQYTDGDKWADDVAAIIEQLALGRPVLVGWSYGGFVILDFIRKHGQSGIAGINLVGAPVLLGEKAMPFIGPGFLENAPAACGADLPTSIAAMRRFIHALFAKPLADDDFEVVLAFNMVVPPSVRAFLIQRELDFTPVLERIEVPVLVTHGRSDRHVLPTMADRIRSHCRTAEISLYDGVGHAPFLEEPERFNRELAALARSAHARAQLRPDSRRGRRDRANDDTQTRGGVA